MSTHAALKHKRDPDDDGDDSRVHNVHPGLATVQRALAGFMNATRSSESFARTTALRSIASLLADPETERYDGSLLRQDRDEAAVRARELLSDDDHRVRIAAVNLIANHSPVKGKEWQFDEWS